jgi:hypothetical protein
MPFVCNRYARIALPLQQDGIETPTQHGLTAILEAIAIQFPSRLRHLGLTALNLPANRAKHHESTLTPLTPRQ